MSIKIEISVGELLDKITILQIKAERISDTAKLENIEKELGVLQASGRPRLIRAAILMTTLAL